MSYVAPALTREALEELYINQRVGIKAIARKHHCRQNTVQQALRGFGFEIRPRGSAQPRCGPRIALDLTEEILKELYVIQGLSKAEIGLRYGCSRGSIHKRLVSFGIEPRLYRINPSCYVGMKHGCLTVIKQVEKPLNARQRGCYWLCKCDCGKEKVVRQTRLFDATSKGCGCQRHKKGDQNPRWKEWSLSCDGYLKQKRGKKYIYQHRDVMEKMIGRALFPEETVHHRNGIRSDNRPENLELWTGKHASGVRIEDLVAHAVEVLRIYSPEKLVIQ